MGFIHSDFERKWHLWAKKVGGKTSYFHLDEFSECISQSWIQTDVEIFYKTDIFQNWTKKCKGFYIWFVIIIL